MNSGNNSQLFSVATRRAWRLPVGARLRSNSDTRMKTSTARATHTSTPLVNSPPMSTCCLRMALRFSGMSSTLMSSSRTTDERLSQMPSAAPSNGNVASKRGPHASIQRNVPPGSPAISS